MHLSLNPLVVGLIVLVGLTFSVDCKTSATRKFEVILNPDCPVNETLCTEANEDGSFNNLLYIKATGEQDILHMLYSTIGSFSIIFVKTDLTAAITVDWVNLLSNDSAKMLNSIDFTGGSIKSVLPVYSIPTIYEFDDENGDADMTKIPNNASYWVVHKTADLIWDKFELTYPNETNIGLFHGHSPSSNGTFQFLVRYRGIDVREKDLPHSKVDADSSAIDFILDDVTVAHDTSKFGLSVVYVGKKVDFTEKEKSSMDDEYTPGTFKLYSVQTSDIATSEKLSYFQFKPIFYFVKDRTLENSTITKQYNLGAETFPEGMASVFYTMSDKDCVVQALNISLGVSGNKKDGYNYAQSNYSVWSFSVGLGEAPMEKMSFIVTLVIFIGFGLPALVILAGLVIMIVRKIKNRNQGESGYGQL